MCVYVCMYVCMFVCVDVFMGRCSMPTGPNTSRSYWVAYRNFAVDPLMDLITRVCMCVCVCVYMCLFDH